MEAIKQQFTTCNSELDKCLDDSKKPWTKYLALAEEKTNVPRKYIALGKRREILRGGQSLPSRSIVQLFTLRSLETLPGFNDLSKKL